MLILLKDEESIAENIEDGGILREVEKVETYDFGGYSFKVFRTEDLIVVLKECDGYKDWRAYGLIAEGDMDDVPFIFDEKGEYVETLENETEEDTIIKYGIKPPIHTYQDGDSLVHFVEWSNEDGLECLAIDTVIEYNSVQYVEFYSGNRLEEHEIEFFDQSET